MSLSDCAFADIAGRLYAIAVFEVIVTFSLRGRYAAVVGTALLRRPWQPWWPRGLSVLLVSVSCARLRVCPLVSAVLLFFFFSGVCCARCCIHCRVVYAVFCCNWWIRVDVFVSPCYAAVSVFHAALSAFCCLVHSSGLVAVMFDVAAAVSAC